MADFIEIRNLKKYFMRKRGKVHAVDDVSMTIRSGETMGVVGESGCGKTTLGRVIVHLEDSTDGKILLRGRDVTDLNRRQMREYHSEVQFIFQDPYSSLNPRYTVEATIQEPLRLSRKYSRQEIDKKTTEIMDLVGIAKRLRMAYPHEMDGGRRQRVGVARALSLDPKFIVCDEPVSALDVSIQAQILNLLQDLQKEKDLTYMFITHDLSVVRHISHNISVMYLGQLVEISPSRELFKTQYHPYTKALLSAVPSLDIDKKTSRVILKGEIVVPFDPEPGCRFAARCPYAAGECTQPQQLMEISPGHFVSCCRVREVAL